MLLLPFILVTPSLAADFALIYPRGTGRSPETSYNYQLLRLAMQASGRSFTLRLSDTEMTEERARKFLISNDPRVTVASMGTSRSFEKLMKPVRIPTAGGLLGNRLFLIHRDQQPVFSKIRSIEDLQRYTAGQGTGWSDVGILGEAGLPVHTSRYELLFDMVQRKRVDYFPRGANEITSELTRFGAARPDMVIEKDLVLVYPFAWFFFVNKDNQALHDAINNGLQTMHENGSFIAFFRNHPSTKSILQNLSLDNRRRLVIDNPLLTAESRAIPSKYWFDNSWLFQGN